MHFKMGLYEHQSAGALQGLIDLLHKHRKVVETGIKSIKITAYQPAFGIIGDPAKRDPHTRQSADHSMVYIVATKLQKAIKAGATLETDTDEIWKQLMLLPEDYSQTAIQDKGTRALMEKIVFEHGGKEYDDKYPDGIPTSVTITDDNGNTYESGLIMYPAGHARNTTAKLDEILQTKHMSLAALAVKNPKPLLARLTGLATKKPKEIAELYSVTYLENEPLDPPNEEDDAHGHASNSKEEKEEKKGRGRPKKASEKKEKADAKPKKEKKEKKESKKEKAPKEKKEKKESVKEKKEKKEKKPSEKKEKKERKKSAPKEKAEKKTTGKRGRPKKSTKGKKKGGKDDADKNEMDESEDKGEAGAAKKEDEGDGANAENGSNGEAEKEDDEPAAKKVKTSADA